MRFLYLRVVTEVLVLYLLLEYLYLHLEYLLLEYLICLLTICTTVTTLRVIVHFPCYVTVVYL